MNFIIDVTHCGVSVAQCIALECTWGLRICSLSYARISILYQFYFTFCRQDMSIILSQLKFGGTGYKAVVYQGIKGIKECFPTVKIENLKIYLDAKDGSSPDCALSSVKEATLVDRQIKFKTLQNEECILKNNCRCSGGGGVEEVHLHVQVPFSNQGVSNCVLLVKFGDCLKSESWGSGRYYAVCEAILNSQPGPYQ